MTTIYTAYAQIAPCSDAAPHGHALEIFYTVEDDTVILTNEDGRPLHDSSGRPVSKKTEDGEDARLVANKLGLRRFRSARDEMDGFNRPLSGRDYPPVPV
jgi:hypothetical protein